MPRTRTVLSLVFGIVVLGALLLYVGLDRVIATAASASPGYLALAFVTYATFFVLRGARWRMLLAPVAPRTTLGAATGLTAFGWVVNTFVPMKAGDVARAALLDRREKTGLLASAGSIAVERALDVVGLAAAASLALFLAPRVMDGALPPILGHAVALAWVLPLLGLVGLLGLSRYVSRMREQENPRFLIRLALNFSAAVDGIRRDPWSLARLLPLTLAVTAAQMGIYVFLVLAFSPAFPVLVLIAGVPIFLLSFFIAVTPGNVGTYEAAFVAVFALLGVPVRELIPLAVACHLATTTIVTLLGVMAVAWLRIRAGERQVVAESLEVEASR